MMARIFDFARICAFILVLAGGLGFIHFAHLTQSYSHNGQLSADGIVVLTGGEGRVSTAITLMEQGKAQRLLISGVHPDTSREAIRDATNARADILSCCVDLGLQAADTLGNAEETAKWVESHDFHSLIVVTSNYHMPRALLEMQRTLPQIELIAYGVAGPPPWRDGRTAKRWLQEYLKYIAVYGRETTRKLAQRA
ncbi:YdcF family protein [Woodsholea maritima]|uniref:YdcF family protein n=1 Tax=Woodsholea maritima TaxID=240237 RepID=UPI0003727904|nr:YdcF family protein [Woodsholea maritima]